MCHPEIVLRPHRNTAERTGRQEPYRGYADLLAYADDIAAAWKSLTVTPTVFRPGAGSVIVFGHADTDSGAEQRTMDVLWVWRLRDGLVTSVDIFEAAGTALTGPPTAQADRPARLGDVDHLAALGHLDLAVGHKLGGDGARCVHQRTEVRTGHRSSGVRRTDRLPGSATLEQLEDGGP